MDAILFTRHSFGFDIAAYAHAVGEAIKNNRCLRRQRVFVVVSLEKSLNVISAFAVSDMRLDPTQKVWRTFLPLAKPCQVKVSLSAHFLSLTFCYLALFAANGGRNDDNGRMKYEQTTSYRRRI